MKITIDRNKTLGDVSGLFGIFFEDLNHAADGGLYAELIRNRSFEFCEIDNPSYTHMTAWEKVIPEDCRASVSVQDTHPAFRRNPHYLVIDAMDPSDGVGVRNLGFNSGIPAEKDGEYRLSFYAACDSRPVTVEISLEGADGSIYACESFDVADTAWKKYSATLKSGAADYSARLGIRMKTCGRLYIDMVSLFPKDTFNGRENGLRKDLALLLKKLHPSFLRFPGGCLIHDGSLKSEDRVSMFRWKNTIGNIEERPSKKANRGINQTLGLGFYEYFLLCEDIGAKPLPVVLGGYDPHHRRAVPIDKLDEWVQDALDLIEFANGDKSTKWGAVRAEMGHEKPFGLEYIGIGNEEVGEGFFERYPYFHRAVREKYPDIKIINSAGPFVGGGEYERGWKSARENGSDFIDEHYYLAPEWFIAHNDHYDNYTGQTKVFLGEYASWGNTWFNALAEASYMTALERNANAVGLACYAPLFCNVDYINWQPDMIWFDNHRSYATANYYVQKLFMCNRGNTELAVDIETESEDELWEDTAGNGICLIPQDDTVCEYLNVTVSDDNGERSFGGFTVADRIVELGGISGGHCEITADVRMIKGIKGFKIAFDYKDDENKRYVESGGWQNMDCCICEDLNGRNSCLDQCELSLERGRVYRARICIDGSKIRYYIDNKLMNTASKTELWIKPVYVCASEDDEYIYTKLVNLRGVSEEAQITANGADVTSADIEYLAGYDMRDENSFEEPEKIYPQKSKAMVKENLVSYTIPPRSVSVVRIKKN